MTFREWFCKHVCPCPIYHGGSPLSPHPAADEVRKASHALNNAATSLQGALRSIGTEQDTLDALLKVMHGRSGHK